MTFRQLIAIAGVLTLPAAPAMAQRPMSIVDLISKLFRVGVQHSKCLTSAPFRGMSWLPVGMS